MKLTFKNKQIIGKADKMIYGHFLEHFHRQVYGGVYDPTSKFADEDGFRTDVLEALKKINTPIIRWPGGCYVSGYDWHFGVGKDRIPTFDKAWRVEESNEFGTDEFIKLCRKIGCEPYICTNAGTGTAEQMSNWVEYCNLKTEGRFAKERIANGYTEPHAIKYWSIGNENWAEHEMGSKDADEWGRLVRESAKMMHRVDPSIELSAASIDDLDWNLNLLRTAGHHLDWISIHGYWDFSKDGEHHADYNTVMLRTGEDISKPIERVRAYLKACRLEDKIKISFDEWNLRGWFHPNIMNNVHADGHYSDEEVFPPRNKNDINKTYNMADAVCTAAFLNTCLKNCDIIGMACFSPIVNTRGAIFTHKDGIVLRPQYFVFDMYSNLLKDTVLNAWEDDTPTMTGTDKTVLYLDSALKEKTVNLVDAVVTWGDGQYSLGLVNKDAENEQTIDLSVIEDSVSQMKLHVLNGPSTESYNDIGRTEVGVTATEWLPFENKVTLSAHSVCVLELK